jgi:SAM-dependent methyltransferase
MIHPAAAAGFARSVEAYERARPEYPAEAIAWLARELDLRGGWDRSTVVDLAAGSGKLSRPLAALGCEVIAVEPVAEMRAAIGQGIRALDGTAEAMPLPDDSADAVTVGQAFHWFDGPAALAEIERVLRPGGALALVWNRRPVESSALHAAMSEIMAPYRGDAPAHASGAWREAFAGRELTERRFDFAQRLDADGLADRVGSTSFIAALDEPERTRVLERVGALAGEGAVDVPYVCEVHVWRPG